MEKLEYAVYEYTEKAKAEYVGTRFISGNPRDKDIDNPKLKVVAKNLTHGDAKALCDVKRENNVNAYLSSIPEEFRDLTKMLLLSK